MAVTLLLAGGPLLAAETPTETGAFNSAYNQLRDTFWQQAEAGFAEFSQKFTNSVRLPEAFLYQAQARYQMTNYAGAIELLLAHQGQAGKWADQYLFWLGQAYLKKEDYPAAGGAFSNLVSQFRDSARCLEAGLGEATAWAKRGEWPRVLELLQKPDGVFQSAARTNSASEQVQSGYLLLAEGLLSRQDYGAAEAILQPLGKAQMNPRLAWQRQYMVCRIRVAQGRLQEALQSTTNLVASAATTTERGLLAESFAFQAGLCEQLGRGDEAITAYTNNLASGFPPERQRQALEKITELCLARNLVAEAAQKLEEFSTRCPDSPATDLALLMLGEMRLRQYVSVLETNRVANLATNAPAATNLLWRGVVALTELAKKFPQSPLAGRGQLDLGWCRWLQQDWPGCQAACQAALERLPVSPDQATARFKLADAQYEQKNFAGAITNYNAIIEQYGHLPEVKTNLFEAALYQAVRAGLDGGDLAAASNALAKILALYPNGFRTERATLLAGQAISRRGNPAAAREILAGFAQRAPEAKLLPWVSLAIARTYEQENKLPEAIAEYTRWLQRYPDCVARPQAEYCLALAHSLAGHDTNALSLFTNFVARFPTNELTPLAQWWIGSCYFGQHAWVEAELSFKLIFEDTNLPASELRYPARMMAGRAAFAYGNWPHAINHFTNLTSDLRCPRDLWLQAMSAYGDTVISQNSTNKIEDYKVALAIFSAISEHPTNRLTVLALGQKANCLLQWALLTRQYEELTNAFLAYQQVVNSSNADVSARSMALVGQGAVLEKQAQQKTGPEHLALLEAALNKYLYVFYGTNLHEGEQADSFWVEKAGLEAARLVGTGELHNLQQEISIYERLKKLLPPRGPWLDAKIIKAREKAGGH